MIYQAQFIETTYTPVTKTVGWIWLQQNTAYPIICSRVKDNCLLHVSILYRLWDIHCRIMMCAWNVG